MKTVVIGLGLIGGSIALDLKRRGFVDEITGVEKNSGNRKKALELGIVDKIEELDIAISNAELIILAIPVNNMEESLPNILRKMKLDAVVTDVGSTKEAICKKVKAHELRGRYVSGHPMAGTENSGPLSALFDLFNNRTGIICDDELSDIDALKLVERMYRCLGMRIVYMNSQEHDLHTAYISHLSHITAFALANAVLEKEKDRATIFDLAGGGFESTARLGKSNPAMWAPIFKQNKNNICEALDMYIKHLELFKKNIEEENASACINLMQNANSIRKVLTKIENNNSLK